MERFGLLALVAVALASVDARADAPYDG